MVLISCLERSGKGVGPLLSMLVVEFISASSNVLARASLIQGTTSVVLNFYTFVSGSIFMAFLALIIDRKNRPPLDKWLCFRIFVMAFLGMTMPQNMIVAGLHFISATIESAMYNTLPIVTYIWAVVIKQEKLDLNTWWGRGKPILEMAFLQSPLHVGSVVGSIVILVGLYIYLWSKHKDEQNQKLYGYESIEAPALP